MIQGPVTCRGITPGRDHVRSHRVSRKVKPFWEAYLKLKDVVCKGNTTGTWGREE